MLHRFTVSDQCYTPAACQVPQIFTHTARSVEIQQFTVAFRRVHIQQTSLVADRYPDHAIPVFIRDRLQSSGTAIAAYLLRIKLRDEERMAFLALEYRYEKILPAAVMSGMLRDSPDRFSRYQRTVDRHHQIPCGIRIQLPGLRYTCFYRRKHARVIVCIIGLDTALRI